MNQRYKDTSGVIYEIGGTEFNSVLYVVHREKNMIKNKPIVTERKESYLRADGESCLRYLFEIAVEPTLFVDKKEKK